MLFFFHSSKSTKYFYLALKLKLKPGFVKQVSFTRFWDGADSIRGACPRELAPRKKTKYLRDLCDGYITLKYQRGGKLSRSVELQQRTRSKPEDERIQLNSLNITVPDRLTLVSRNEVNNRTGWNGLDLLEANWFLVSPMVGGWSGKLVKFQQHTRKKPEDEKFNWICLIFRYQTFYHKVGVMLQHSFAELWGRFEEFLAIFFTFFPNIFRKILVSRFES